METFFVVGSHNLSQFRMHPEKVCAVYTSPLCVCMCVRVFAYLCGFAYLVFVQGYKGTFAPGSQPGTNEWDLLHHC